MVAFVSTDVLRGKSLMGDFLYIPTDPVVIMQANSAMKDMGRGHDHQRALAGWSPGGREKLSGPISAISA